MIPAEEQELTGIAREASLVSKNGAESSIWPHRRNTVNKILSNERFSQIVGLIYDAALDRTGWPIVMEMIRVELNCCNATLDLQLLPSGDVVSNITTNIPSKYVVMMKSAGADVLEGWGGPELVSGLPLDCPAILTRVNPSFDIHTTTNRYYLEFAKPQGIVDVLAIGLARDAQALGSMSFGRHRTAGQFGDREVAIAQLLVPHLQRAATINRMLDHAALAQASLEAALDALTAPVMLVGADLRIVHSNAAAVEVLSRGGRTRRETGSAHRSIHRRSARPFRSDHAMPARPEYSGTSRARNPTTSL